MKKKILFRALFACLFIHHTQAMAPEETSVQQAFKSCVWTNQIWADLCFDSYIGLPIEWLTSEIRSLNFAYSIITKVCANYDETKLEVLKNQQLTAAQTLREHYQKDELVHIFEAQANEIDELIMIARQAPRERAKLIHQFAQNLSERRLAARLVLLANSNPEMGSTDLIQALNSSTPTGSPTPTSPVSPFGLPPACDLPPAV